MTDLPTRVQEVVDALRRSPSAPTGLAVAVAGRPLRGWSGADPLVPGPGLHDAVVAATALELRANGLLSDGTTVGECIPQRALPAGLDPFTTVAELLARWRAAAPQVQRMPPERDPSTGVVAARLLSCIIRAACGESVATAAERLVLHPRGMTATRLGDDGSHPAAGTGTTTLEDLLRLVTAPTWAQLAAAGVIEDHGRNGRIGLQGRAGHPGGWCYPRQAIGLAVHGEEAALVAALDSLVSGPRSLTHAGPP